MMRRPGDIVTREELQQALWSADTFVEFDQGLNTAIKKIRQALGDSTDNPRFLEFEFEDGGAFWAERFLEEDLDVRVEEEDDCEALYPVTVVRQRQPRLVLVCLEDYFCFTEHVPRFWGYRAEFQFARRVSRCDFGDVLEVCGDGVYPGVCFEELFEWRASF